MSDTKTSPTKPPPAPTATTRSTSKLVPFEAPTRYRFMTATGLLDAIKRSGKPIPTAAAMQTKIRTIFGTGIADRWLVQAYRRVYGPKLRFIRGSKPTLEPRQKVKPTARPAVKFTAERPAASQVATYQQIASATGVSRQSAHQRLLRLTARLGRLERIVEGLVRR